VSILSLLKLWSILMMPPLGRCWKNGVRSVVFEDTVAKRSIRVKPSAGFPMQEPEPLGAGHPFAPDLGETN